MQIHCASTFFFKEGALIYPLVLYLFLGFLPSVCSICIVVPFCFESNCSVKHLGKVWLCEERSDEVQSERRGSNSEGEINKKMFLSEASHIFIFRQWYIWQVNFENHCPAPLFFPLENV
jgi:hypothetical protein